MFRPDNELGRIMRIRRAALLASAVLSGMAGAASAQIPPGFYVAAGHRRELA
jgi:ABC-type uncharacterized transport system permease subunit